MSVPTEDAEYARQQREWQAYYDAQVAKGLCPHSGDTIMGCKRSDLCDCFDFPEHEARL
jgi:hypothetical protein